MYHSLLREVVEGHAEITTKNGNTVSREGDEENPAVKIKVGILHRTLIPQAYVADSLRLITQASSGSDAIKKASELDGVNPTK